MDGVGITLKSHCVRVVRILVALRTSGGPKWVLLHQACINGVGKIGTRLSDMPARLSGMSIAPVVTLYEVLAQSERHVRLSKRLRARRVCIDYCKIHKNMLRP